MKYTVKQLAQLSGVTPRTLRHYDNIGLLVPQRLENGYRCYSEEQVALLQQILFFRESGLALSQIASMVTSTGFDGALAMEQHIQTLYSRRQQLEGLISTAEQTLKAMKGERTMSDHEKFECFKQELVQENENQYGEEVRQKWGAEALNGFNAKMLKMTESEFQAFEALGRELNAALAEAVATGDATGKAAQRAAGLHKEWLGHTWTKYSPAAHRGLCEMYVQDPRFTAYYEEIAPGAAAFLQEAVAFYTKGQE